LNAWYLRLPHGNQGDSGKPVTILYNPENRLQIALNTMICGNLSMSYEIKIAATVPEKIYLLPLFITRAGGK